jgi:hypothetical protein
MRYASRTSSTFSPVIKHFSWNAPNLWLKHLHDRVMRKHFVRIVGRALGTKPRMRAKPGTL